MTRHSAVPFPVLDYRGDGDSRRGSMRPIRGRHGPAPAVHPCQAVRMEGATTNTEDGKCCALVSDFSGTRGTFGRVHWGPDGVDICYAHGQTPGQLQRGDVDSKTAAKTDRH